MSNCHCCQAEKYSGLIVNLTCEDGRRLKKQLAIPSSCSCQSCASSNVESENRKTKSKS